jgi:hypothetical protein
MFAALLYKEYREHRSIWLALALVGAVVLCGVPLFYGPDVGDEAGFREAMSILAVSVAWTYGLVCGAMLLAGEQEGGTQAFLDTLPTSRLPIWLAKFFIGQLLVCLQIAILAAEAFSQGFFLRDRSAVELLALIGAGMIGFGWGLLASAVSRNVLNAIALAMLGHVTVIPFLYFAISMCVFIVCYYLDLHEPTGIFFLGGCGIVLLILPLPLSALEYTRCDRRRRGKKPAAAKKWRQWSDSEAVRWLAWRQLRGMFLGLLVFSLVSGIAVIGRGLFTWPVLTLGAGAFCGVAMFLDEQCGAYRFLAEQRFPLGTIWKVKVGFLLFVLLVSALLMLVPSVVAFPIPC